MPIADWTVPFNLTSAPFAASTLLPINQHVPFAAGDGIYLLRQSGCALRTDVRASKRNVPQEDGAILSRRFVTGCEMDLAVQMWEWNNGQVERAPACNDLLQEMLDEFMGYAYGLLNAGDNQGRISWTPSGQDPRMLDDLRLWTYPLEAHDSAVYELGLTVDCALPYSEDLNQDSTSLAGGGGTVPNDGNRPSYPVWKIYGPFTAFTLASAQDQFVFDTSLFSPTPTFTNADYIEINTFANTAYKNGTGANLMPGIVMTSSEFFLIPSSGTPVTISYVGGNAVNNNSSVALTNNAWA